MSSNFTIFAVLSVVASLFIVAGQVAVGILALREHTLSAWLMLAGSAITVIGRFAFMFPAMQFVTAAKMSSSGFFFIFSALNLFGPMLFIAGLLIFVMHRRLLSNRIIELEAILADRTGSP